MRSERGGVVTLLAAVSVHLLHWISIRSYDPFYSQTLPNFDMDTYWTWALSLVGGDWFSVQFTGGGPFCHGPLYPHFLAFLIYLFGPSFDAIHGIQTLLGILPPLFVYAITRRLFGNAAALAAGLLAAVCAPFLFYEQHLLMEGLLLVVHSALLYCLIRGQSIPSDARRWAALSGVLSAIACWGRASFLLAIPLLAIAWIVIPDLIRQEEEGDDHSPSPDGSSPPHSNRWMPGILYLGCAALFLAIPLCRNVVVANTPVVVSGNGPLNLYIGNAHDSIGVLSEPPSLRILEDQYGSRHTVPWGHALLRDALDHPVSLVLHQFKKAWIYLNGYEVPDNVSFSLSTRYSGWLRWNPVRWSLVLSLAVFGIAITRHLWRRQTFLYLYVVAFSLSIIVVFISGRFRLPALLPLLIWSGVALSSAIQRCLQTPRSIPIRAAALWIFLVILLLPWSNPVLWMKSPDGTRSLQTIRDNDYSNYATAHFRLGERDRAVALLEEGVERFSYSPHLVPRLVTVYVEDKSFEKAVPLLETYLQLWGDNPLALLQLADCRARLGSTDEAIALARRVLQIDPGNAAARAILERLR